MIPRSSLRPILIFPFVLQIFGTVGLVGYLSYQSGQRAVSTLIIEIEKEISDRIDLEVLNFLDKPQLLLRSVLSAIESGNLDPDDRPQLACYFFGQVKQPALPPHLGYGDGQGNLISVEMEDEGEIILKIKDESTGEKREFYEMGDRCQAREFLEKSPYDPRLRGWYRAGIANGKQSWSELYRSVTSQNVEVSAVAPVYRQGEAIGVLYSELILSEIADFLRELNIGSSGQAFIMERSGAIVASTAGLPFDIEAGEPEERQPEQLLATQSNQPLIRKAALGLMEEFGTMKAIARQEELILKAGNERLFVQAAPLTDDRGLDWLIVVVVPESDFLTEINTNRRNTITLSFLAAIAASIIGIFTARWITAPIMHLNSLAAELARGQWDKTANIDRADEVGQLAKSFNAMAEQLQASFNTLEQRVQERTAELVKAKKAAEVASEAKSAFLANMNHELRTPLNAILGFAQILMRSQHLSPDLQDNATTIYRSGEYLLELVNQILDLSKLEAGRTSLHESNFDFDVFLDELENMFQEQAKTKGLHFSFKRGENLPRYLKCDRLKLRQILINLLGNGIKFTAKGKVTLSISAIDDGVENSQPNTFDTAAKRSHLTPTTPNQQHIHFKIEDTGPGIDPDEFPQLFEAFGQTKTGIASRQGTGLGLPLARRFIGMMGGEITAISKAKTFTPPHHLVDSDPIQGTIFKFSICATPITAEAIEIHDRDREVIALEPGQTNYRILVADDRETNRKLLVKLLAPLGLSIQEASQGLEAIEICQSWKPHLIFMDLRMPVMNGDEATQKIRAKIVEPTPIIIALTTSILEEEQFLVLKSSFDDFVAKPIRAATIFDRLAKHLGVRYLYQDEQGREVKSTVTCLSEDEASNLLQTLSPHWTSRLQDAANRLDEDRVLQLIQEIESQYPQLAETLVNLIQKFRFDAILNLLSHPERP